MVTLSAFVFASKRIKKGEFSRPGNEKQHPWIKLVDLAN